MKTACVLIAGWMIVCCAAPLAADQPPETLRAASDWEADEAAAVVAAEARLLAAAANWLTPKVAPYVVTSQDAERFIARPEVNRNRQLDRKERAYGLVVQARAEAQIPSFAVSAWHDELMQKLAHQRQVLLLRGAATGATMLFGLAAFLMLDRRTRGYRRGTMGAVTMIPAIMLLAAIWYA